MIGKIILVLSLFAGSIALAAETMDRITFGQGTEWSVSIHADGSAVLLFGSSDRLQAPPGSFDLKKIDAKLRPLATTNPSLEKGVKVYRSFTTDPVAKDFYYTENIDYLKGLIEEVFEKSRISAEAVERFQKWFEKYPPLGVQLYFDERQILRREYYIGPPIRLRKPPPWLTRAAERYPLLGKFPVMLELFSTPWPYLALLALLALGVRRYRLNKRSS